LGANLRKIIPICGITQKDLATKLGITNAMLSRYIHGTAVPSAAKLHRIAKALGCTMDELFDGTYME
jgi:transcriptional regulator with XRE-family HTH domain